MKRKREKIRKKTKERGKKTEKLLNEKNAKGILKKTEYIGESFVNRGRGKI
jgi:hypothetical protein